MTITLSRLDLGSFWLATEDGRRAWGRSEEEARALLEESRPPDPVTSCPACGRVPPPGRTYCDGTCRVRAFRARARSPLALQSRVSPLQDQAIPFRRPGRALHSPAFPVAALYVQPEGVYSMLPGVDCWDRDRDATRYPGASPVVAHPPCAPWGRYRHWHDRNDAHLAVLAIEQVRTWGGILEHPAGSDLWRAMDLPRPENAPDRWGGRSYLVRQSWWGHAAPKPSWLYVVGFPGPDLPQVPAWQGEPSTTVGELSEKEDREATPLPFAAWLVSVASACTSLRNNCPQREAM